MTATREHLHEIAAFLQTYRPLWEERPFLGLPVPWEQRWPTLSALLRSLDTPQIEAIETDPVAFVKQSGVAPDLVAALERFASLPAPLSAEVSVTKRPQRVDDRKWRQIAYFIQSMVGAAPGAVTSWVDWCAGKGQLGEALFAELSQPVTCVEINGALVEEGNRLAGPDHGVRFVQADVLTDDVSTLLTPQTGVVALHACGHLNGRLLELTVAQNLPFLAVVPCCYQRIDGMHFVAMSKAGRETGLALTRHQLRLPALDEVKTSAARREFRRREMAFRLGVDLLLREAKGEASYTPLGKIPPWIVRESFADFARFAAANVGIALPQGVNWEEAQANGFERRRQVFGLGISRQLFRRTIEMWLFLDRVAYLEEHGYGVRMQTFCPRPVTPRNLMLLATRP